MKKYELDATNENLKQTLKRDCIGRNNEIMNFLALLDCFEGSVNISLDANWGNGKTFFVKQLEILLNYFRKKVFGESIDSTLENVIVSDSYLNSINMCNTFIPIYYDAWLYDDHKDPLLSLIFSIIKNGMVNSDSAEKSNTKEKIISIASSLLSLTGFNIDLEKLAEKPNSYLDKIYDMEDLKSLLKSMFNDIITEKSQKLIVIIDELDRCKPDYAVNLLERIKHFFDDDRVIFLFSTNKEQLVHTVKKFYGYHFDATSYLNRFFDFQFTLSDINTEKYLDFIDLNRDSSRYSQRIARQIGQYYNFSIREYNIYYQKLLNTNTYTRASNNTGLVYLIQVFGSIIWALSIKNIEKERKFLSGELLSELEKVLDNVETLNNYAMRYISSNGTDEEKRSMIQKLYIYLFKEKTFGGFNTDRLDVNQYELNKFISVVNKA